MKSDIFGFEEIVFSHPLETIQEQLSLKFAHCMKIVHHIRHFTIRNRFAWYSTYIQSKVFTDILHNNKTFTIGC